MQLIDIQPKSYTITINGVECIFMKMSLYAGNNLHPLTPYKRKNKPILYWKVKGKQVSFNQIKKMIKNK